MAFNRVLGSNFVLCSNRSSNEVDPKVSSLVRVPAVLPPRITRNRISIGVQRSLATSLVSRPTKIAAEPNELDMFRMTAAAAISDPDVNAKCNALVELTGQEFGLVGVRFEEVMDMMGQIYAFSPKEYTSGAGTEDALVNLAGENNGSCKVFAFGKLTGLSEEATLLLFCEHYQSVLDDPDGDSHMNIRNFMKHGWAGIEMKASPLVLKDKIDSPMDSDGI